ncbi:MAG TPA: hypothetical protein VHZ73_02095 [Vicinamibacterales bacterium]|nr:hypothetical protein [Vicinamibacterales bacterium]
MQYDLGGAGRRLLMALAFAAAASVVPSAQSASLAGTWTLNAAKSTLGGDPPRSQTVTFRTTGLEGISATEDTIYADGVHTTASYTGRADGRDYRITGSPDVLARTDAVSLLRRTPWVIVWTYKKDGAAVLELTGALSFDGNVLTLMTPGNTVMLVYERHP